VSLAVWAIVFSILALVLLVFVLVGTVFRTGLTEGRRRAEEDHDRKENLRRYDEAISGSESNQ